MTVVEDIFLKTVFNTRTLMEHLGFVQPTGFQLITQTR